MTVGCWPTEDLSDENKNSARKNVALSILSGSNVAPICWIWVTGLDQEPPLDTSAPKKPFAQPASTKRSAGAQNQNAGTGGLCAA
jgi:hypothetical protein